jgi:hypothetical protein
MVSQNYRFYPAPRAVAALLAERSLGDLYEVSIDFRRNDPSPPKPRRRHHSDAQPLLLDMSIHHFDLLRYLLEREADSVLCEAISPSWSGYAGPPAALATIDFDGVAVSYRGSWISAGPSTNWAGDWRMEDEPGRARPAERARGDPSAAGPGPRCARPGRVSHRSLGHPDRVRGRAARGPRAGDLGQAQPGHDGARDLRGRVGTRRFASPGSIRRTVFARGRHRGVEVSRARGATQIRAIGGRSQGNGGAATRAALLCEEDAPGPLTQASAPQAPGRLGLEDASIRGSGTL